MTGFIFSGLLLLSPMLQSDQLPCPSEVIMLRTLLGARDETIEIQSQAIAQLTAKLNRLKKDSENEDK